MNFGLKNNQNCTPMWTYFIIYSFFFMIWILLAFPVIFTAQVLKEDFNSFLSQHSFLSQCSLLSQMFNDTVSQRCVGISVSVSQFFVGWRRVLQICTKYEGFVWRRMSFIVFLCWRRNDVNICLTITSMMRALQRLNKSLQFPLPEK